MQKNKKNKRLYLDLRPRQEGLGVVKKCKRRNADSQLKRIGVIRGSLGVLACIVLCFGAYFAITMYIVPTAKTLVPVASPTPGVSSGVASELVKVESSQETSAETTPAAAPVSFSTETGLPIYDNKDVVFLVNSSNPLPENYKADVVNFEKIKINSIIMDALTAMKRAADKDKVTLAFESGYISKQQQQKLYDQKVSDMIELDSFTKIMAKAKAKDFVSLPGFADVQTGLCVTVKGRQKDFEKNETYLWLNNNAAEFGFVFRYPGDKKDSTGVQEDLRVLRYVGTENAIKMRQLTMCLEEYTVYLRSQ